MRFFKLAARLGPPGLCTERLDLLAKCRECGDRSGLDVLPGGSPVVDGNGKAELTHATRHVRRFPRADVRHGC